MFYSSDLLIFKKGKFSLIWLAATRGEKYISKRDLMGINIEYSCSEIRDLIMMKQKPRVSLYLSSQLTFGLCILYNRKMEKLIYDLKELLKKSYIVFSNDVVNNKINYTNTRDINLNNSIDENELNYLENINISLSKENIDLENQFQYLNQARFEDITLIDAEIPIFNENKINENDLEPINFDVLNEIIDNNKLFDKRILYDENIELNQEIQGSFDFTNEAQINIESEFNNDNRLTDHSIFNRKRKCSQIYEDLIINAVKFIPKKIRKLKPNQIIVDSIKTISYQDIRANMFKDPLILDKKYIFPNPKMTSKKYQLATNANNLFKYPCRYELLFSKQLFLLWMKRYKMSQTKKRTTDVENKSKDGSIEKARKDNSSFNQGLDSFIIGSDSIQRSIRQSEDKPNEEAIANNSFKEQSTLQTQGEKIIFPILEEDMIPQLQPLEIKEVDFKNKEDIWNLISMLLTNKLKETKIMSETFILFSEVCPPGNSKRSASLLFISVLRLGKYKKIKLLQKDLKSDILIGYP